MNKSILEDGGEILVISQFTLHASTKKGKPPPSIKAAKPDVSIPLYEQFCKDLSSALGKAIGTGTFRGGYESRTFKQRPCYYMYRYQEQRITD